MSEATIIRKQEFLYGFEAKRNNYLLDHAIKTKEKDKGRGSNTISFYHTTKVNVVIS